jgi:hypothetical protein
MQAVMADLHRAQFAQAGYPRHHPIEAVVRDMRIPVRDLVGHEVKHHSEEEGGRKTGLERRDEGRVVKH